jgi:hypothetical protein
MRLLSPLIPSAVFLLASPLQALAPPSSPSVPPARTAPAPAQIRLEMRLTRSDKEGGSAADAGSASSAPPAIATPTLSTLDRGTATVSVTNKDLSYSVSASPSIEQAGKADSTVQVLWNMRLSGRTLPGGTNAVTTTGATRITPDAGKDTLLTELPISDAKTGSVSVFRLTVRVIVTRAATPGPEVGPVPPAAPPAS